jgi:translation initiation factor 3 subunit M
MSIPTFSELRELEQCEELRKYLKDLGATISAENSPQGFEADLEEIIRCVDLCFNEEKEEGIETVLNSVVSLLIQVPHTHASCHQLIISFCEKLVKAPSNKMGLISLKVLNNLFEGLGDNKKLRYDVYLSRVTIAGKTNTISLVFDDINKVKTWFGIGPDGVGIEKFQRLFRLLHDVLLQNKQGELASKVMIDLLGTYTEENASQARDDAHKCIVSSVAAPNTFLMDHLLTLKPVKFLEGELIHDLLTIFVSEKLSKYMTFYQTHQAFVDSLGLSHEQNMHKMRLLTFMQVAEGKKEIPFELIQQELQIQEDQVESYVIDVLKTKLVRAKIDQLNRKVLMTSTMHRTFGKPQWLQLKDTLTKWHANLGKVQHTLASALRNQTLQTPA